MIRLVATVVLTAALAILAAGCGGEASKEEWAGDVCSSVSDWRDQIQQSADDVREALSSPGTETVAAIEIKVQAAVDATETLADDLQGLEPPDTEGGEEAKQELDALAVQLESTVTNAKEIVESLPEGASLTQVAKVLAPLVPSLQTLATNVSSALTNLKERGSELQEGFESADSCEEFR